MSLQSGIPVLAHGVHLVAAATAPTSIVFAVMLLSSLVIGLAIFLILMLDPAQKVVDVAFEVFSAYSTVGLSLGITAKLSTGSKMVLIVTMFLGRVGTFTLIAGMLNQVRNLNYRYPTENIIIT